MSELLEKLETLTYSFDSRVKMREIVKAEAIEALEQSEWERVLIERLAVLHILSPEHETNPSKALHDIISYEVLISLDPLVSSDAVALIEKYGGTYPPAEDRDMSDTEHERYIIKYATVDAWSPEMPRIYDSLGNLLAICDDIDAADIILLALNAKPEPDTVTISRECAEYLGMMLPRILSDRGIAHYKELTKAMEVKGE